MSRTFALIEIVKVRDLEVGDKIWTATWGFRRIVAIEKRKKVALITYNGIESQTKNYLSSRVMRAGFVHTIPEVSA